MKTSSKEVSTAPATTSQDAKLASSKETIPNVELTDEIFFKVVSAEVAFQRGDFPAAFATTIAVAQQTHDPRLAKRALEMALIAKQPLQAFLASRLWHEYSPNSEEATQYYLGFMILESNFDEVKAIVAPRLAAATPKERGTLLLQTQRLLARSNDKAAAFNLMEELCKPYPNELGTHLALAQAAHASNNNERALTEARAALQIDPSSQVAALTIAQASPTPKDALKALADFLAKNPKAHEVRRAYAGMLIDQKLYSEARIQLDTLAKSKPQDPSLLYALGVLSLQLKDDALAEKYLTEFVRMIEANPNEKRDPTSAYLYLSQIADDKKDGVTALAWLAKVQSYDGKNAAYFNAQLRRALLIAKYGSHEEARQFLHELSASSTSQEEKVEIIQIEAELLRNDKRDVDAINLLQQASDTYPNSADLLYDFAMMAEKAKRFDEAERALRRVIEINPNNQNAYNALGFLYVERNMRLPEARVLLEKALSLAPDDAFIIDSMGWLEFRENHNEKALVFLERAYEIRPDADIGVHLGEVLWVMGEQQKAKDIWKDAQKKDPDNAALKNMLERLQVSL
jgi:Flp pilus assembly protein TadD